MLYVSSPAFDPSEQLKQLSKKISSLNAVKERAQEKDVEAKEVLPFIYLTLPCILTLLSLDLE